MIIERLTGKKNVLNYSNNKENRGWNI